MVFSMNATSLARRSGWGLYLFSAFLGACSSVPTGGTDQPKVDAGPNDPKVVVLHFSDLHGQLRGGAQGGGYARLAAYVRQAQREAGPKTDVLVLFGGDLVGKTAMPCRQTKESACAPLLARIAGDLPVYAVLGNHELDRPAAEMDAILNASGATWLGGAVSGSASPKLVESVEWTGAKSGARLTLAGWTRGEAGKGLKLRGTATAAALEKMAPAGASHPVLWLTHQPWEDDVAFASLACARTGRANLALLKGDDHKVRQEALGCLKVFEPGPFGEHVTRLEWRIEANGKWTALREEVVPLGPTAPKDESLDAEIVALYAKHAPQATEVVAQVAEAKDAEGVMDWLADAYRGVTRADVAIVNSGAVKAGFAAGPLERERLLLTIPYNNDIHGLDWPMRDLEQALCRAALRPKDPITDHGSELHLSGARLVAVGQPDCRLEGPRRASLKVAVDSYVLGKSAAWLGKDLRGKTFRFQVSTEQAMTRYLKLKGGRL